MANSHICLLCFIGLPGSGKTYLSRLTKKKLLVEFSRIEIVCYDDIIEWGEKQPTWKDRRKSVYDYVEEQITTYILDTLIHNATLIILDDNMYYRSMRYEFYRLAKKYNIKFCQVYLEVPITLCIERNYKRETVVSIEQLLRMNDKLEAPCPLNEWEKDVLKIEYNTEEDECLDKIRLLVLSQQVLYISSEPRHTTDTSSHSKDSCQNNIHLADLALRKIVTRFKSSDDVHTLNKKRKEIICRIRNGELQLPQQTTDIQMYIDHLIQYFYFQEEDK